MIKCGFYERCITPPLGASMEGYFIPRPCEGIKDELYVKALAVESEGNVAAIASIDIISLPGGGFCERVFDRIEKYSPSLKRENIIITATHSHTSGPCSHQGGIDQAMDDLYIDMLILQVADSVVLAQQRMEEMNISYATTNVEGVSFVRNYVLEDGSVYTNPGYDAPIVRPYCETDTSLPALFFYDMSGKIRGVLTSYACHHDTIGGRLASADYSGVLSRKLKEEYGSGFVTVFLNGFCGNVNHVDWIGGPNKTGIPNYIRIGSALAENILASEKNAQLLEDNTVSSARKTVKIKRRVIDPTVVAEAKDFVDGGITVDDFDSGRPESLAFRIAVAPTIVGEYYKAPDEYDCPVTVIRIGDCAIYSTPCEVFNCYAADVKNGSPTDKVFIAELSGSKVSAYIPSVELLEYTTVYENHPTSRRLEEEAGNKLIAVALELGNELFAK